MSSPAGNDATDIVAIKVDGDDSPEVVRLISISRGRPTPTMGRPRAVLQLELQPVAQVHSELRSEGNRYQAQIILLLILLPGHATVPVEPTIQLTRR